MLDQKPDPRRSQLPFTLRVRMSDASFRALALVAAAEDVSAATIARRFIDAGLEAFTDAEGRTLLDVAADEHDLGLDQVQEQRTAREILDELQAGVAEFDAAS